MKYFLMVIASAVLMFVVPGCDDEATPLVDDVADVAATEEATDVVETEAVPDVTEADVTEADVTEADVTEADVTEASD